MVSMESIPWGMVVDGIQIGLCVVILACLIHGRRRTRRLQADAAACGAAASFSDEVLLQSVRQRAEMAFSAIAAALEAERLELQRLCDGGRAPRRTTAAEPLVPAAPFRFGEIGAAAAAGKERYEGVGDLAAAGLSARQIAEQLKLPAGEVELVMKMQATLPQALA
jgi:DNA-binding NarL/FixJ family response regulator